MTNSLLICCSQHWSALEDKCMRPVGACVTAHAVLCLGLRLAVRGRGCVRRAVSVPLGSIWVPQVNVWQLTSVPACMMDSSTSLMMYMQITTVFGQWLRMLMQNLKLKTVVGVYYFLFFCLLVFACVCSYCEKGSMRCSSTETTSLLSDLFYDDDPAPSRGITECFRWSPRSFSRSWHPSQWHVSHLIIYWTQWTQSVSLGLFIYLLIDFLYTGRRSAQCPPPLVRAECDAGEKGLESARTCQNLDLPFVSSACIPGCLCPPGTVGGLLCCARVVDKCANINMYSQTFWLIIKLISGTSPQRMHYTRAVSLLP